MEQPQRPELKLINNTPLQAIHDHVFNSLDRPEKLGISTLLRKNNGLIKKEMHRFLQENQYKVSPSLLAGLDHLLETHARECYTIGYLDCMGRRS